MSLTFPGLAAANSGTQQADLQTLINNMENWAATAKAITGSATATYKAINEPYAYYSFLKQQIREFDPAMTTEFAADPDAIRFKVHRKYMCIFANIILHQYFGLKVGCRERDYKTIGNYDNVHDDLITQFGRWAEEIDEKNSSVLTEIYVNTDGVKTPIAFISQDQESMIVFPYNTIKPFLLKMLIGWDEDAQDFTMEKLERDLKSCPTSERALYAALKEPKYGFNLNNVLTTLANWLSAHFTGVVNGKGMPFQMAFNAIHIDDTTKKIEVIPIPRPAISPDVELFSKQLLIVGSNINVKNEEYGFCRLDNNSIGLHDSNKVHAAVPPISPELIEMLATGNTGDGLQHEIEFIDCNVLKNGSKYDVTITLSVDGAVSNHHNTYFPKYVKMCYNFPLISILKRGPQQAWMHRTDYHSRETVGGMTLEGRDILFSQMNTTRELQFSSNVTVYQDTFNYFSISYHDSREGVDYGLGYLFFTKSGSRSLYQLTNQAASRTMIIDEENDIAKIASYEITATPPVSCFEVLNDHIMLIDTNLRDDLDHTKNHCWGDLNVTIFQSGTRYILAPFSKEFARMIVSGDVTIQQVQHASDGAELRFAVTFMFGGRTMITAPHRYSADMQYLMPNPPFFRFVENFNAKVGQNGFELVKMQNMGLTQELIMQNSNYKVLDSNDLIYRVGDQELEDSLFVENHNDLSQMEHIQIYGQSAVGEVYYGQISLSVQQYKVSPNFYPLMDTKTNCHAILLVRDQGTNRPKQIITGRVFDDNLFLIAQESTRSGYAEYEAWRSAGMMVDILNMTEGESGDNTYSAVFPFSLNMLRNLTEGNIEFLPGSLQVEFDRKNRMYKASVNIKTDNNGAPRSFARKYGLDEVIKCDNLPFVLPLGTGKQRWISRFNNESTAITKNHIDGKSMTIEYIQFDGETTSRIRVDENQTIVPVKDENVILRLSAPRGDKQYGCHLLYKADDTFKSGVWAVKSEMTGAQHVVDFDEQAQTISKIKVFTDYIMFSTLYDQTFANETPATKGGGHFDSYRMYSIPVTKNFTHLMMERGLSIDSYASAVEFYTDPTDSNGKIKNDSDPVYVRITVTGLNGVNVLTYRYDPDHVAKFEDVPLPTLTVFPYVNFVAGNGFDPGVQGQPIWNHYVYASIMKLGDTPMKCVKNERNYPIGSRVDFYVNDQRMDFNFRSTKVNEARSEDEQTVMKIANVDGWSDYIHLVYNGSNAEAAASDIDRQLDGQEFGCIIMGKAKIQPVNRSMEAKVGVDFGTRNSIIALLRPTDPDPYFPYHGTRELQQVIIPTMDMKKTFPEFTNLSYIPHFESNLGKGCGKFASTVMAYSLAIDPNETVNPYDKGFVPNVKGRVLEQVMETMDRPGSMGTLLGYYSDLKVSTSEDDANDKAMMRRNVRTFIKSIMFHTVLNCYQDGCAQIDLRFSVPSEAFAQHLLPVWKEAVDYIREFIPDAMNELRELIQVNYWATEANALFQYLKHELKKAGTAMTTYSAITDGGDGTYDFTINKFENNVLTNPAAFSLRYAGQEIMTDSVNTFYDYLNAKYDGKTQNVLKVFEGMWKVNPDSPEKETLELLVKSFSKYKQQGISDRQTEKTLILMLIEQFGIDSRKLSVIQTTAAGKKPAINPLYINFVRMIQYKFLFLFNVLGEQIRANNIRLDKQIDTSFNVYLYGGTAQAITIAEPYCQGNIQAFVTHADKLPMAKFIEAMLDFPRNVNGSPIHVQFFPAKNSEKTEIVSGLVTMTDNLVGANDQRGFSIPGDGFDPGLEIPQEESLDSFDMDFGFGMAETSSAMPAVAGGIDSKSYCPKSINELIDQITAILQDRRITLPKGEYNIDRFITFIDETDEPIKLSEILQKDFVKSKLEGELATMWTTVCTQNEDIAQRANGDAGAAKLLHQIYLLKMVGYAIETYLKR